MFDFNSLFNIEAKAKIIETNGFSNHPELDPTLIHNRTFDIEGVSLAISGGSTRAYTSAIGFFMALSDIEINNTNLINASQFISSVSGGSWFTGTYLFAKQANNLVDKDLFGIPIPLNIINKLTLESFNDNNENFMGKRILFQDNYLNLLESALTNLPKNIWIEYVGKTFLQFYNIDNKVVALNDYYANEIKIRNPDISDIIIPPHDAPFWIGVGSLLYNPTYEQGTTAVEMTPLYTGFSQILGEGSDIVGGNLIETFGYGCKIPLSKEFLEPNLLKTVSIPKSQGYFKLENIIGISSAVYANNILNKPILNNLIPSCDLWCSKEPNNTKKSFYGDGFFVDNSGILALVSRKVKRIISFFNPGNSFVNEDIIVKEFIDQYAPLYGTSTSDITPQPNSHQIFESFEYMDLLKQINEQFQKGGAVYAQQKLRVLQNERNAVEGNYELDLLIIIIQSSNIFNLQIPANISIEFSNINSPLYQFPNYPDIELKYQVIDYPLYKTNLLISYIYWLIQNTELKDLILSMYLKI